MKKKQEANDKEAFLKAWAKATVNNLINMEKEGKTQKYRNTYMGLSIHSINLAVNVVDVNHKTEELIECLTKYY